ncbi:hypothetical protein F0562_019726 [Nyssa sinensis]|uniref:Uncharacterized protein n=1 Tax=Nyssa sinensis TaxID=561372 RepID=A0A5J5BPT0_9ASTE|nr:hypothetical protein F0562_019726 [Nyssa sinensis]
MKPVLTDWSGASWYESLFGDCVEPETRVPIMRRGWMGPWNEGGPFEMTGMVTRYIAEFKSVPRGRSLALGLIS